MTEAKDYLEQLTPDNAAILFIDSQTTLTLGVQSIDMTLLKTNTEGLAKLANLFDLPVVLTTTGGGAEGPSGPLAVSHQGPSVMTLCCDARLTRSGMVMKLVESDGRAALNVADPALIRQLARAHRCWRELRISGLDMKAFAKRQNINPAYLSRLLRLVFLSPKVTEAILAGTAKGAGGPGEMMMRGAFPSGWRAQERLLLRN